MSRSFFSSIVVTVIAAMLPAPVLHAAEDADAAAVAAASGVPSAVGAAREGWRGQWGLGVIANPKFVGGDEYNITPIPYLDFRYLDDKGTRYFANVPQGLGGFLYRKRDRQAGTFINVGLALAPGFNVRDDSIEGLDEIGISTEARMYLEAGGRRWVAAANIAQDVGSGHEGAYIDMSLQLRGRLGNGSGFYAVGPILRMGDDTYKGSFFGVTEQESVATGLPAYNADGGVERVGLGGLVSLPLGQSKWRLTTLLRVNSLIGDAADSPIVQDETQFFFLTAFTRPF